MPLAPARWFGADASHPLGKVVRYTGASVVATICSEATFVLLYGPAHVSPGWSSVVAWFAGAVPNFWLSRRWAWQRKGGVSLRRELAPYAVIILATLALATVTTSAVDALLRHLGTSASVRVTLAAVAFFAVYVVMFGLRFVLLDRLFRRLTHHEAETRGEMT